METTVTCRPIPSIISEEVTIPPAGKFVIVISPILYTPFVDNNIIICNVQINNSLDQFLIVLQALEC